MVTTHVVVTILIIPGEQCISPTPLLFSHEKQGFPLPTWLARQQMCHIVWVVTMHVVITVLIITGEQPPFFFFISDAGGHIALSMWQPYDTGQTLSNNNNCCCHHHSESLHPTSSLPHPTNIPPPQPRHPSPATISHNHNRP